jgi:hypothetical protein
MLITLMPTDTYVRVELWQFIYTPKSYGFSTKPKGDVTGRKVFLPLSQISTVTRFPYDPLHEWQRCLVTIPDWLFYRNQLEEYQSKS